MRICVLGKFPPIQGGIAASSYWLTRGLAEAGAEIEVVTNANCVEPEYRIAGCTEHLNNLRNIRVHDLNEEVPWHIPFSKTFTIRLLNLALKVHKKCPVDVIDAGFLIPYGIVAFLASQITGIPYIIRHGGSDVVKFLNHPEFSHLLTLTITNASLIITHEEYEKKFRVMNPRIKIMPPYVPDERYFRPTTRRENPTPVVAYVGKVNYYWQNKRLGEAVKAIDRMFDDYRLIFVAQGHGLQHFKQTIGPKIATRIEFKPFVPPWDMPDLVSSVDYVLLARDVVVRSPSNLEKEAIASCTQLLSLSDTGANLIVSCGNGEDRDTTEYSFGSWVSENLGALKGSISTG